MRYSKEGLEKQKQERLGETIISNEGCKMKIVEYNKYSDIWIEFQDEHKARVHSSYKEFKMKNIKNPYYPSVCNIGYIGEGKYKKKECQLIYATWRNMIHRCYDPYELNRHQTYIDCYICDEWLNFQNFAEWWEENYYNCNNEMMCLDKDILYKKNNLYSPKTCIIVPERINKLFIKQQRKRGKYPIGVCECYDKRCDYKYLSVRLSVGEMKYLGNFPLNKPFQAFYTYKIYKEKYIKQVADEYKEFIPIELYEALYRYEVEIND